MFKNRRLFVENQYNKKIKIIRSDTEGEYVANVFQIFLQSKGIKHEKTVPETAEQTL